MISSELRNTSIQELNAFVNKPTSIAIEQGIFQFAERTAMISKKESLVATIYKDKVEEICFTFSENHKSIQKIKKRMEEGTFDPLNLACLQAFELDKGNWKEIIRRMKMTQDKLRNLPTIEWKPCKNCKLNEYFYYQLQTRCADEPITTFYICKNCAKTYKVNN